MNLIHRVKELKGKHKGQECVVMGTGPSLNDFIYEDFKRIIKGKVDIRLKSALKKFGNSEPPDYHILNDNNLENYDHDKKTKVIVEMPLNHLIPWLQTIGDYFFLVKDNTKFSESLSATHDFDSWTIEKSPFYRPFGPGLLYEVVIPLIHYMGFSTMYTIGVDLGPKGSQTRDHFFNERYLINPAHPLGEQEAAREIELTRAYYEWLKSNGLEWFVANKNSYVHEIVPRIKL